MKPSLLQIRRIVNIAAVENHRIVEQFLDAAKIRPAKLIPFRQDQQRRRAMQRIVVALAYTEYVRRRFFSPLPSLRDRMPAPWRPPRATHSMTVIAGASRMSSVRGLNARPQTAKVCPDNLSAEMAPHFVEQESLLPLIDLFHRFEQRPSPDRSPPMPIIARISLGKQEPP